MFGRCLYFECMVASLLLSAAGAHGANLATNITAGFTNSINDTVPSGGTKLNVATMLTNAAGNEFAVFHAERLQFAGTLTIGCPTTAGAYTIPLMVTIVNGTTGPGMTADAHIQIEGVLGGGSRVSIAGGSYTFGGSSYRAAVISRFMTLITINITDGSILEMASVTLVATGGFSPLIYTLSTPITLSDNSTLSIYGTTIEAHNVSVGRDWQLYVLYTSYSNITLSNNSTLSIYGTTIEAHNVSVGSYWNLYVLYTLSSPTTLSSNSTLSIHGTTIEAHNVSVVGDWQLYVLCTSYSNITLSDNSTLSIYGTTIGAHNVSVKRYWYLYVLYISLLTLSDNSTLSIYGTTIEAHNVSVGRDWQLYVLCISWLTLSNNSTLSIYGTTVEAYNVSVGSSWWVSVLSSNIALSNNSTLSIHSTNIGAYNVSVVGDWWLYTLGHSILSSNSTLFISGTTVGAYNVNVKQNWRVYVSSSFRSSSSITLSDNSTLSIYGTTVGAYNMSVVSDHLSLGVLNSVITLSANSTLSIHGTTVGTYNVRLGSYCYLYVLSTPLLTFSNNSALSIHSTTIEAYNVQSEAYSMGRYWQLYVLLTSSLTSSPITLSDNSTLSIHNTTFGAYNVSLRSGYWQLFVLDTYSSPITLSTNSALSILGATIEAYNVSVGVSWQLFVLSTSSSSPITLSNSSTLSIYGTTVEAYNVSVGGSWSVYIVFASSSSPITLSTNSALSILGATIEAYNVSVGDSWQCYVLSIPSSSWMYTPPTSNITLSGNSTLSIYGTTIGAYNVNVKQNWLVRVLVDFITRSSNSTLSIYGTTIEAYNVQSFQGYWDFCVLTSSPITLSDSSTLSIHGTTIVMHNVNVRSNWRLYVLSLSRTVLGFGTLLSLAGVDITLRNTNIKGAVSNYLIYGPSSDLVVNGTVEIKDATIDGAPSKWINFLSATGSGRVAITNVAMTGAGDMVSGTVSNNSPTFYVCRNFVNGALCPHSPSGGYPCAPTLSQRVQGCTFTSTTSLHVSPSYLTPTSTGSPHPPTSTTGITPTTTAIHRTFSPTHTASASGLTFTSPPVTSPTPVVASTQLSITAATRSNTTTIYTPSFTTKQQSPSTYTTATRIAAPTASIKTTCSLNSTSPCPYTAFANLGSHAIPNITNTSGCGYLTMPIPYSSWSSGGRVNVSVLLVTELSDFHIPGTGGTGGGVDGNGLVSFSHHLTPEGGRVRVDVGLRYVGGATRGSWSVVVDVPLLEEQFSCALPSARVVIPLTVYLEAAPPIPSALAAAVDTLTVVSVVTPTGLVRGGMVSSLLGMMRCTEFDPDDSLSFVNNPTGWAIGESGPRYQRGSAATMLIALCAMGVCALVGVGVLTIAEKSEGGVGGAIDLLRLPSVALPAVLLLSEVGVSSAVTLVLYEGSEGSDVVLALAVLFVLVGYMVLQAVRVLRGRYTVERVWAPNQSVLQYVLDPTHEVDAADERWVRRNFYFVDGRSWPLFGVIEVAAGTLSNVLEGIPLTSSVMGLCAARPACILVMSFGLLVLLVWRVPNAVRLSQVGAVVVTTLMCVCSAAVLTNVVSPSDGAEGAATYIGLVVSVLNGILGIAEVVGLLLAAAVPSLGLRGRTLQTLLDRRHSYDEDADGTPMLFVL